MHNGIGIRYVSDPVRRNHRVLENIYKRIANNATEAADLPACQQQFVWELARHITAERLVIYPVIEKKAKDGRGIARKRHQEHQSLKEQLIHFESLKPSDKDFKLVLESLMKALQQHINEVERQDLVALEGAIEGDKSEQMARNFAKTKHFVPVEIHAHSQSTLPYKTVTGLLDAPWEELVDAINGFPENGSD